MTDRNISWW